MPKIGSQAKPYEGNEMGKLDGKRPWLPAADRESARQRHDLFAAEGATW